MAKYQRYEEYKDSGVEWLGEIPSHWEIINLGYLFDITSSKRVFEDQWRSEGVPFYRAREVVRLQKDNSYQNELFISNELYEELCSTYGVPQVGDILVTAVGTLGITFLVEDKKEFYFKDGNLIWLKSNGQCDSRFINYCYASFVIKFQMFRDNLGATVGTYTIENAKKNKVCIPRLTEQKAIVDFLDCQIRKIDTLIAKQEKLIELLKEKRQAVISHAVTKGLNPNVPMKDSGVEWLGDVPEGWEVAQIRRYLVDHRQGYYTTEAYVDDGLKLLRITDLRDLGEIEISNCPMVNKSENTDLFKLKKGDVVFARTGGAGSFGVMTQDYESLIYASYLIRFRFIKDKFEFGYLKYLFQSDSFQLSVKRNIHGGVNQNIHAEDIKDTFVCIPYLREQVQIAQHLDQQCLLFNVLISKAIKSIELMQERRTALISAVVTGKIDVRNWQATNKDCTHTELSA